MLDINRIQAICFDVDGTLSDTDDLYVKWLAKRLFPLRRILPGKDPFSYARRIVMSIETPGNMLYTFADRAGLDKRIFELIRLVKGNSRNENPREYMIIQGVEKMLSELSVHFPLSVVSARDRESTLAFLKHFDLDTYFTAVATAHTCRYTKPYPDPVLWAAERMDVPARACLMVGDTRVDILAGRSAGAQTVGVLCGFGQEPELRAAGADMLLDTTAQLTSHLLPDPAS